MEQRIRDICETRVRFGYRRVHVLLRREGWTINLKKTYRIYRELGMQLRNKTPKRRVKAKLREDRQEAAGPNDVWAMDFVHEPRCQRSRSVTGTSDPSDRTPDVPSATTRSSKTIAF